MKARYDFGNGRRGTVVPLPKHKVRITIRLDRAIVEWFKGRVAQGGGNYQTLINDALTAAIDREERPALEELLRRVVREELKRACSRSTSPRRRA